MYSITKSAHNVIGMAVMFILLVIVIIVLVRLLSKKPFDKLSKTSALIGLISTHLQILLGFLIYFISPVGMGNMSGEAMKETISRFYIIEHPVGMILAAVLITIGYRRIKNDKYSDAKKHQQILIFYGLGLAIISYFIPWFVWS